jgi:hypothetical protein
VHYLLSSCYGADTTARITFAARQGEGGAKASSLLQVYQQVALRSRVLLMFNVATPGSFDLVL